MRLDIQSHGVFSKLNFSVATIQKKIMQME